MATILTPVLSSGAVSLDTMRRELIGPAGVTRLNRGPYLVLKLLMSRPGVVRTLDELVDALWMGDPELEPGDPVKAARMAVRRARDALERVGVPADRLALRFQQGYALERVPGQVRVMTADQAAAFDRFLAERAAA